MCMQTRRIKVEIKCGSIDIRNGSEAASHTSCTSISWCIRSLHSVLAHSADQFGLRWLCSFRGRSGIVVACISRLNFWFLFNFVDFLFSAPGPFLPLSLSTFFILIVIIYSTLQAVSQNRPQKRDAHWNWYRFFCVCVFAINLSTENVYDNAKGQKTIAHFDKYFCESNARAALHNSQRARHLFSAKLRLHDRLAMAIHHTHLYKVSIELAGWWGWWRRSRRKVPVTFWLCCMNWEKKKVRRNFRVECTGRWHPYHYYWPLSHATAFGGWEFCSASRTNHSLTRKSHESSLTRIVLLGIGVVLRIYYAPQEVKALTMLRTQWQAQAEHMQIVINFIKNINFSFSHVLRDIFPHFINSCSCWHSPHNALWFGSMKATSPITTSARLPSYLMNNIFSYSINLAFLVCACLPASHYHNSDLTRNCAHRSTFSLRSQATDDIKWAIEISPRQQKQILLFIIGISRLRAAQSAHAHIPDMTQCAIALSILYASPLILMQTMVCVVRPCNAVHSRAHCEEDGYRNAATAHKMPNAKNYIKKKCV